MLELLERMHLLSPVDWLKFEDLFNREDQNELRQAQKYLEQAAQENLPQFLVDLGKELADKNKSQVARMAAGLQLKNALTSKDLTLRIQYQKRWLALDEQVKHNVKQMVIQTLGTEEARPAIAPQCIAAIACAEIPNRQWLEVTDLLQTLVVTAGNTDTLKEQALVSIGYICQDIEPEHLVEQSHEILTAIESGMRKEEPNIQIRLAATNALLNSLEFLKQNFEREAERKFIMEVVCEAAQSNENQLKVAALQNLVKIMSLYYQHMGEYIGRALVPISISAITSDCDEVSQQGIEFWSSVCDEEVDLAEAAESNLEPAHTSSRFNATLSALPKLIPVLTNSLKRQGEFDDKDGWSHRKAAGACLMLLAECYQDDVLPYVLDILTDNIEVEDWESRDAAVMAFGSILEGPHQCILKDYTELAMPMLIEMMNGESVIVTDSMAWTLCRLCRLVPRVAIAKVNSLLQTLLEGLEAELSIAINAFWVLRSLIVAFEATHISRGEERPLIDHWAGWLSVSLELSLFYRRLDANEDLTRDLTRAFEEISSILRILMEREEVGAPL